MMALFVRRSVAVIAVTSALLGLNAEAFADVTVRNLSGSTIWVATAARERSQWVMNGWFPIESGSQKKYSPSLLLMVYGQNGQLDADLRAPVITDRPVWFHPTRKFNIKQEFVSGNVFVSGVRRDAAWLNANGYQTRRFLGWRDGSVVRFGDPGYPANRNAVTWLEGSEPAQSFSHSHSGFKFSQFKLRNATSHKVVDFTVSYTCNRRAKNVRWSTFSTAVHMTANLERGPYGESPCLKGKVTLHYLYRK
jgi:hypothetical protein